MATKITYRQETLAPSRGDDPSELASIIIPHVEGGWIQIPQVDFTGGGSDQRFLLHIFIIEPAPESDNQATPGSG